MSGKVPLNQLYKEEVTKQQYPLVNEVCNEIVEHSVAHDFIHPDGRVRGRHYDDAVLFTIVKEEGKSFEGATVCDLGARDGIFGSWLTKHVGPNGKMYISDYFEEWGKGTSYDLGQIEYWTDIWTRTAHVPEIITCEHQDMTKLTYPDNMFDYTISTSVIEHIHCQNEYRGDMIAMRELVRVTKPGGYILLSTDMTKGEPHNGDSKWHSGTFYYNHLDIFDRLINVSGCELVGEHDFTFDAPDNTDQTFRDGVGTTSSVVFALRKPL
jgi:ubiquinone/menaquinone biosynthesis C-methylase UbiE